MSHPQWVGGGDGGWGALVQVSYGGVQLKPLPYFREISQSRASEAALTPKTYPILGKIP